MSEWRGADVERQRDTGCKQYTGSRRYTRFDTALCSMLLAWDDRGLVRLVLEAGDEGRTFAVPEDWVREPEGPADAVGQLKAYLAGELREFSLELNPVGTDFQKRVWDALCRIPYGEVRSYGDLAASLGKPSASRAVGAANGRNPLPLIVPCHRVIGADGSLTGYAFGTDIKRRLLEIEGYRFSGGQRVLF